MLKGLLSGMLSGVFCKELWRVRPANAGCVADHLGCVCVHGLSKLTDVAAGRV